MTEAELTADRLRELLRYDPETGQFTRLVRTSNCTNVGDVAGGLDRNGHVRISIDGRLYAAHRLAWLYMNGEWPVLEIDHRDTGPSNNRWKNLREVTHGVNQQNQRRPHRRSTTGHLGVTFNRARGKFQAQISVLGARKYLGLFDSAEQAHAAYLTAKRELHEGNTL